MDFEVVQIAHCVLKGRTRLLERKYSDVQSGCFRVADSPRRPFYGVEFERNFVAFFQSHQSSKGEGIHRCRIQRIVDFSSSHFFAVFHEFESSAFVSNVWEYHLDVSVDEIAAFFLDN